MFSFEYRTLGTGAYKKLQQQKYKSSLMSDEKYDGNLYYFLRTDISNSTTFSLSKFIFAACALEKVDIDYAVCIFQVGKVPRILAE